MPFLSIACATACSQMLGCAWYSPYMFGNVWLKATGKDCKGISSNCTPFIVGLTSDLGLACALDHALPRIDLGSNWRTVAMVAGGFSFIHSMIEAPHYAYEERSTSVFGLSITFNTVRLAVMTFVMLTLDRSD
ncbi:uncharacterized protein LOC100378757 [Saccoglossus kowalevskii]|uniref:Uncharacterized protein LOC100378757 isoform X1 n=1 Tax=Saccoglossus kowalevskii TaxID=10224 RepID=A0ABM0M1V1_SACKO|nr:PREDICTED: uncharacterized protein LOC100378757 isoform X1 [Saccoglossus kowalevskii]XP_006813992.1 PREDICTED: uncharacterized protein LOC100378757 isoform X2 [Saccoglossus kowalevskii]